MLDINLFRNEQKREEIKKSEKKRFRDETNVDKIYQLDRERIEVNFKVDNINKELNKIQNQIKKAFVAAKKDKVDQTEVIKELENLKLTPKEEQASLIKRAVDIKTEIDELLHRIGNIVEDDVPVCKNDDGNIVARTFECSRKPSKEMGYAELMANFTNAVAGAEVVGHRGYYLEGKMALLSRALKNYAIDFLAERGFNYIQVPVMMRQNVMALTSQLSDFDDQLYKVDEEHYLIATSEQPMTALFMNQKLTDHDLPKRYAGDSLCFRKEAGAYGKDNAGIFRVHQFDKIEQFVICKAEDSNAMHEEMIKVSEEFYKTLDISYQVVLISSGELNDAASKKYDLEAYFPHAEKYRELVSASNCTDYQSRNLNVGYGYPNEAEKQTYVHMLNSTLCAVQRSLCCVVENYQEEGRIAVPEVLRKYTNFDYIDL
ncbi:seryl-tRNA synthetase [Enteropsectra breve]|nr:seryl-tRNA synthetase [Enteropsectra breve]